MIKTMLESIDENYIDLFLLECRCETACNAAFRMAESYCERAAYDTLTMEYSAYCEGTEITDDMYYEASDSLLEKAANAIKNIIDSVVKFITGAISKVTEKLASFFAKKNSKNVTAEDYLRSDMFNTQVNIRYVDTMKEIDKQMSTGELLLRKAASKLGINQNQITAYQNVVRKFIDSIPPVVVTTTKVAAVAGSVILLRKNYKKIGDSMILIMKKCGGALSSLKKYISKDKASQQKDVAKSLCDLARLKTTIASKIACGITSPKSATKTVGKISSQKKFSDWYNDEP